jgi:SAM-dependent methyltransferase
MNRFHRWVCGTEWWKRGLGERILPWALENADLGGDVLEVGPGPGMTTDLLKERLARLTSIEVDSRLAAALERRMRGTNVTVVEGDATGMPFGDDSFSGAVSFTMLHHVPSRDLQNRLLSEVLRVLKPGGWFVGTDSRWTLAFGLAHLFDTMILVDPSTFGARLEAAGFVDARVDVARDAFRFRARKR